MKRYLVLLIWMVGMLEAAVAQLPTLRNFASLDYNGGTQNWGISCSDDYRMLFANNNGLLSFDGDRWMVSTVPNYTNVRAVEFVSESNRTYVGATDEFGYFQADSTRSSLQYVSVSRKLREEDRVFGEIWRIHPLGKDLVFRARTRFFVCHPDEQLDVYDVHDDIENSTVVNHTLYISCKEGIYLLLHFGNNALNASLLQTIHEEAVGHAFHAGRGIDTGNPQTAEISFLAAAILEHAAQSMEIRLAR